MFSEGDSCPQQPSPVPDESLGVSWELRLELEENMDGVVKKGTISQSTAGWLLEVTLADPREARLLQHRFTRPGGFSGENSL